uniref:Glucose-methanol-choline oxidoreductase C-terminal domain-containing protein n=1 Tax=Ciona savignyi TaxID=51511 RepID=H2ZC58_CIOSA
MMLKTNFNQFVKGYSEAASKMGKDHVSTFQLILGLSHPHSTGSIKLQSPDINQHPLIDPHYLEDYRDVKVLVEGFKVLEKLENSKAYKSKGLRMSIVAPNCDSLEIRSEKYYECVARSLALTEYHPCCTAKMGHKDDVMAVTDPRLRVRKVSGLRIADASVMPMVTTANTQSPCYMIGEKAADLIKSDWGLVL